MALNLTLSVTKQLVGLIVFFEILRLCLVISGVIWTMLIATFLREEPRISRASIKDYLHFLSRITEPKFTLVSHILEILKVNSDSLTLIGLLSELTEQIG